MNTLRIHKLENAVMHDCLRYALFLAVPLTWANSGLAQTLDLPLPNGSFDEGLNGWQVDASPPDISLPGQVVVVSGSAELRKRGAFEVALRQSFVAPQRLQALRFRLVGDPQFSASGGFIPEAFEAHVIDAAGRTRSIAWRVGASASFNISAQSPGEPGLGAGVTFSAGQVRIPLLGVESGEELTFVAAFIGASDNTLGSARIDDVVLEVLAPETIPVGSCIIFWNGFESGWPAPPGPSCNVGQINDTGLDRCADAGPAGYGLGCPVAGFPDQDGEHGRDVLAAEGLLGKRGYGAAGFDYLKLDASGNVLPADEEQWSCVLDNHTGLVWEHKSDEPADLRYVDHTYSWFDSDMSSNGGDIGVGNGGNCVGSSCDTQAYAAAVNASGLCGASDWRVPTRQELIGLLNNGRRQPAIDIALFANTPSLPYWTASPLARDGSQSWVVLFSDGSVSVEPSAAGHRVRLVRTLP